MASACCWRLTNQAKRRLHCRVCYVDDGGKNAASKVLRIVVSCKHSFRLEVVEGILTCLNTGNVGHMAQISCVPTRHK